MQYEPEIPTEDEGKTESQNNRFALEVCFLAVLGIIVLGAFLQALSYPLVSARTPFVIMVPLLALIAFQAFRLLQMRGSYHPLATIRNVLAGHVPFVRKLAGLHVWMLGLFVMINLAGHYIALATFIFMLVWREAKERLLLAVVLSLATTAVMFGLFEYGFHIGLYPGLIYRYFAGYRIF